MTRVFGCPFREWAEASLSPLTDNKPTYREFFPDARGVYVLPAGFKEMVSYGPGETYPRIEFK